MRLPSGQTGTEHIMGKGELSVTWTFYRGWAEAWGNQKGGGNPHKTYELERKNQDGRAQNLPIEG